MRGLLPFDGFFGDTALDHFFNDTPAAYKDYVSVPKVDIEEQTEEKDDDRHYIRRERSSSVFRRQFNVKGIKEDGIKAGLKDGILTITLPKLPQEIEKAPHRIQID